MSENPMISWEDWENSNKNIEDVIAFVNTVLAQQLKTRDFYFAIVPTEEGLEIVYEDDRIKHGGGGNMELIIKKDGTVLLLGEEIGKAPHTLEKVKKLEIVLVGAEGQRSTDTIELPKPSSVEEIGLNIYVE